MADTLVYTIPQVAQALSCSRPHVYALIASGRLHSVDIATPGSGRTKLRVRHVDLEGFLNGGTNGKSPAIPLGDHQGDAGQHDLTEGV